MVTMRVLREDLFTASTLAAVFVGGFLGWLFYQQGNLRIDASRDFRRISIGMAKVDVQKLTNWDHLTCKYDYCYFRDFRRQYTVYFNDEGRVSTKQVVFRNPFPTTGI